MKKINCILLIDDNEADNEFHKIVIKRADAANHVKVAFTGMEALEYLSKCSETSTEYPIPDLIFLDINMPGMNGFEFLEKFRQMELFIFKKPVVIIMLTSSLNPDDQQNAEKSFANEITQFRNKPLTADMLKEIVTSFFPDERI